MWVGLEYTGEKVGCVVWGRVYRGAGAGWCWSNSIKGCGWWVLLGLHYKGVQVVGVVGATL